MMLPPAATAPPPQPEPSIWERTRIATERLSLMGLTAAQTAVQATAQAVQDSTTRRCVVCLQTVLRTNAADCPECNQPYCRSCRTSVTAFSEGGAGGAEGSLKQQIVACRNCEPTLRERYRAANVTALMKRVDAFLAGRLEPYEYTPEGKLDQALRLGGHAMYGLKQVVGFLPIGQAANAIKAGYYLVRYGPLILAGNDIMEAFQLIIGLAKTVDADKARIVSPEFFGGLYYMMGEHWGERSKEPDLEMMAHIDQGGVPHPGHELLKKLHHVIRLLYVAKEASPTDAQRLLRQALPGAELVLAEFSTSNVERARLLACVRSARQAYFILPGTSNPADIVADFSVHEEPIAGGHGHRGMVRSAKWLVDEMGPLLVRLHEQGYQITVVGHSLGAGVGALLTLLLRPQIPNIFCYGFGTPACVDENLAPFLVDCMVSVVNRDDIIPRLSVRSVQALVQDVLCAGQTAKTKAWMMEDWQAIKDVEKVVELRRRRIAAAVAGANPAAAAAAASSSGASMPADEAAKVALLMEAGVGREAAERALRIEDGDVSRALLRATELEGEDFGEPPGKRHMAAVEGASSASSTEAMEAARIGAEAPPALEAGAPRADAGTAIFRGLQGLQWVSDQATEYVQALARGQTLGPSASEAPGGEGAGASSSRAVVQHARFLVPGQVVHLFRRNGLSRAALAAPTHETFSNIIVSLDMLTNHKLPAYAEAISQALITQPKTPDWEPYDRRKTCACCNAEFHWAYVLYSEPQRMLARHHCFACGRGVCDGCSQRRMAHADLGFHAPVRTCDSCFFNRYGGAVAASD